MAVEILILSGARQGEQQWLEAREFRVGAGADCEVRFDPQRDRAMKGRQATFRRQDDGWYLRGDVLVNHRAVAGWTRVRSGDIVRMSESGPDLSFRITAGAAPVSPALGDTADTSAGLEILPTREEKSDLSVPATFTTSEKVGSRNAGRRWVVGAAVVLLIGVLGALAVRSLFLPPTIIVNVNQPTTPVASAAIQDDRATSKESAGQQGQVGEAAKPTGETAVARDLAKELGPAVYLIQVEKAGQFWPFATCVAVGDDTLLTTGREAAQLGAWREESELKVWVTRPADGWKEQVRDVRVHGVFASLADKAGDWIYFNLGLLSIDGKLPKKIAVASSTDLTSLEAGLPVFCFGFTHEGDKITRFDHLEPQLARGKIYVITSARELPGHPRLLHVKAEIAKNAYGSPVVDAEGRLIGLYGEDAAAPAGMADSTSAVKVKNLHYVTMVRAALIDAWLKNRNESIWRPAATTGSPKTESVQNHHDAQ